MKRNKRSDKVANFHQQVKLGPYYYCTVCYRSLYIKAVLYYLKFQWKTKKMSDFYWNCLKSDCPTNLGGLE